MYLSISLKLLRGNLIKIFLLHRENEYNYSSLLDLIKVSDLMRKI